MTKTAVKIGELVYQSLGDRAADHIRNLIIRNQLPPGTRLSEESFASDMGVSRACVREAFMRLESEGLVRRLRNRYTEVVELTSKDVEEIVALRCAIETLCAETCIKNENIPVDDLLKQIEIIASKSKEDDFDAMALMEVDFDFHEIIIRESGNSRALNIWNHLKAQMKVLLFAALENKDNALKLKGAELHRSIVDALVARDQVKVISLIKEHIDGFNLASANLNTMHKEVTQ